MKKKTIGFLKVQFEILSWSWVDSLVLNTVILCFRLILKIFLFLGFEFCFVFLAPVLCLCACPGPTSVFPPCCCVWCLCVKFSCLAFGLRCFLCLVSSDLFLLCYHLFPILSLSVCVFKPCDSLCLCHIFNVIHTFSVLCLIPLCSGEVLVPSSTLLVYAS